MRGAVVVRYVVVLTYSVVDIGVDVSATGS